MINQSNESIKNSPCQAYNEKERPWQYKIQYNTKDTSNTPRTKIYTLKKCRCALSLRSKKITITVDIGDFIVYSCLIL